MRFRLTGLLLLALLTTISAASAADPQPYSLSINGTGNGPVDDAIRATSLLASLRTSAPAAPFALIDRARGDVGRFETVLRGFGYYKGAVAVSVNGHDVSDPVLPDILEQVPKGQAVGIKVTIGLGPLYHLRKVVIEGNVPQNARKALALSPGDPAVASNVLGAQARLLAALQEDGHAFATVNTPDAFADDAANAIDVTFKTNPGPQVEVGQISFQGLKDVREQFVRQALTIHSGDMYRPSAVEKARQALLALGVFSGVTARAATHPDKAGRVSVTFDVQERPKHAVALSARYSTDLGGSVSASWSDRNLFGSAEQLNLSAAGTGLGGTATAGIGYNVTAQYIKPHFLAANQQFEIDLGGVKQNLDAYSQIAETVGVFLRRKFSSLWTGSTGLTATHDEVTQESSTQLYQLISLPISATYDSTGLTDPLSDPTHGGRATISATPTAAFGGSSPIFVVLQASGSTYFDITGTGRSIVALRTLVGSIQGGQNFDLPPDQRFYAGGGSTVRGFRYQSIGPHFADGKPAGAASVDAATVEFRQRILSDWGAVAFVDAGQASADSVPFGGSVEVGAGVGARYYTPVGAIRADVAVPITHVPHGDAFEIYISLGQAF